MLMRFDPFREFDRLADNLTAATRAPRAVPLDAYRRGQEMVAEFDLPGVDPDSIDLTVERNVLTVRADRQPERHQGDEILVLERPRGTFTRQLFLGESLDAEAMQASYDQGVLTLRIPVSEQAKPRRIEISQGERGPQTIEGTATASGGTAGPAAQGQGSAQAGAPGQP